MGLGNDGAGLIYINYIMNQFVHALFNECLNVFIIFCNILTFISFKFYLLIEKKNQTEIQLDIVTLLYVHEYLNNTQNIMEVFFVLYFDDL